METHPQICDPVNEYADSTEVIDNAIMPALCDNPLYEPILHSLQFLVVTYTEQCNGDVAESVSAEPRHNLRLSLKDEDVHNGFARLSTFFDRWSTRRAVQCTQCKRVHRRYRHIRFTHQGAENYLMLFTERCSIFYK